MSHAVRRGFVTSHCRFSYFCYIRLITQARVPLVTSTAWLGRHRCLRERDRREAARCSDQKIPSIHRMNPPCARCGSHDWGIHCTALLNEMSTLSRGSPAKRVESIQEDNRVIGEAGVRRWTPILFRNGAILSGPVGTQSRDLGQSHQDRRSRPRRRRRNSGHLTLFGTAAFQRRFGVRRHRHFGAGFLMAT